ncbi:MAG: phospho-sugar mutase, partial [Treponema sp.]|nr:phospho-sugar mutase [Treponema sp.]
FPDKDGNWVLLSGNQMGALLMDYVLLSRKELGTMPSNPTVIRSIVTSPFGDYICKAYGAEMMECLTGFKWIAAVEADFEAKGTKNYVFGLEESYGYKVERDVMDKDGVSAAAMCAEMTMYWASQGKSILEHLDDLYKEHGFFEDRAISQEFLGSTGVETMKGIMAKLRTEGLKTLAGKRVVKIRDVQESVEYDPANPAAKTPYGLPKSNVLQFFLEGGTIVSARPSGTEPKIKFYVNSRTPVNAGDLAAAKKESAALCDAIEADIKNILANA